MKKYILTILGIIGYFTFGMTSLSAREVYDSTATPLTSTAIENQLGFNCSYHDDESGLIYKRHRYYSPDKGTFFSRDPLKDIDGPNLYAGYFATGLILDPMGLNKWHLYSVQHNSMNDEKAGIGVPAFNVLRVGPSWDTLRATLDYKSQSYVWISAPNTGEFLGDIKSTFYYFDTFLGVGSGDLIANTKSNYKVSYHCKEEDGTFYKVDETTKGSAPVDGPLSTSIRYVDKTFTRISDTETLLLVKIQYTGNVGAEVAASAGAELSGTGVTIGGKNTLSYNGGKTFMDQFTTVKFKCRRKKQAVDTPAVRIPGIRSPSSGDGECEHDGDGQPGYGVTE